MAWIYGSCCHHRVPTHSTFLPAAIDKPLWAPKAYLFTWPLDPISFLLVHYSNSSLSFIHHHHFFLQWIYSIIVFNGLLSLKLLQVLFHICLESSFFSYPMSNLSANCQLCLKDVFWILLLIIYSILIISYKLFYQAKIRSHLHYWNSLP